MSHAEDLLQQLLRSECDRLAVHLRSISPQSVSLSPQTHPGWRDPDFPDPPSPPNFDISLATISYNLVVPLQSHPTHSFKLAHRPTFSLLQHFPLGPFSYPSSDWVQEEIRNTFLGCISHSPVIVCSFVDEVWGHPR